MSRKRIGEILLERGAITTAQLDAGLKAQRQTQQRLGATLVSMGAITEPMLVQALSEALEIPVVDLRTVTVDWAAVHLVRARFCEKHEVFPYVMESVGGRRQLVVAMTDPLNQSAIEEIEFTTGLKVSPRVAALSGVRGAIMRYYHKTTPGAAASPARSTPSALPSAARGTGQRPAVSAPPPRAGDDDDEEVIVGEEVGPGEKTERTSLAELIQQREKQRRQKRGQGESKGKSRPAGNSDVLDDLDSLLGGLREEPDRVEELERKFWALMRIMARKGLLTKEEFTRELDDDKA
ncbi:general secretion pathway protein GspE [Hyalangium minutum]|uniref:Type II secretory pathway, ATPase PulE/Tfp pilus assembly pathway, ATPase PilB n=1 Tax=Hyalangium minutum TaxID=394096 RepID=A0A085W4B8_9BACT|nr:general secretion pathway protein GspE [Hyalangium minutum]KFE62531.1 Type II secretory pathway, ATPase PulE/Tfp pilus assembly pathway, ATPase PilB [Hyalangium minutum]